MQFFAIEDSTSCKGTATCGIIPHVYAIFVIKACYRTGTLQQRVEMTYELLFFLRFSTLRENALNIMWQRPKIFAMSQSVQAHSQAIVTQHFYSSVFLEFEP